MFPLWHHPSSVPLGELEAFTHLQLVREETSISFSAPILFKNHWCCLHLAPELLPGLGTTATLFVPLCVVQCAAAKLTFFFMPGQTAIGIPKPTEWAIAGMHSLPVLWCSSCSNTNTTYLQIEPLGRIALVETAKTLSVGHWNALPLSPYLCKRFAMLTNLQTNLL